MLISEHTKEEGYTCCAAVPAAFSPCPFRVLSTVLLFEFESGLTGVCLRIRNNIGESNVPQLSNRKKTQGNRVWGKLDR